MQMFRLHDNHSYGPKENEGLKQSQIFDRLADKTVAKLEEQEGIFAFPPTVHENPDVDDDDMILAHSGKGVRTGSLMGFFGLGDERLSINSRFSEDDENGSDYFLHHILKKVLGFSAVDLKVSLDSDESLYRLLELLFPAYLKRAMRFGVYMRYIGKRFDDSHVRGVIDVPEVIRNDLPFVGHIAYRTREMSTDNEVTELVRHTAEYLLRDGGMVANFLRRDTDLRKFVKVIREVTPSYRRQDRKKVVAMNERRLVRSGYFHDYKGLQRLCIAILRGRRVSVLGDLRKVHGILFDGSWLWEEYLNTIFQSEDVRVLHPQNRERIGTQYFFSNGAGKIYPDFIYPCNGIFIVMDAKYKPAGNISGDDYQQVLSYMLRFDARRGLYLYPRMDSEETDKLLPVLKGVKWSGFEKPKERDEKLFVAKVGLLVPRGCVGQAKFDVLASSQEKDFARRVAELLWSRSAIA